MMTRPSIAIYQEQKPAHWVGADCSVTLKYKRNIAKWEIDAIESLITTILAGNNFEDIENSEGFVK